MLVWHYVLHDLPAESPYNGGVYWGKLVFPKEYPLKPPAIFMLTPSGRFETGVRLCLSMSDFHPETWNPSWRIESILIGLISFMLDPAEPVTTGGMQASPAKRREYARASFDHNVGNAEFRELFPECCDQAKRRPCGSFFLEAPADGAPSGAADSSSRQAEDEEGDAAMGQEMQRGGLQYVVALISLAVLFAALCMAFLVPRSTEP